MIRADLIDECLEEIHKREKRIHPTAIIHPSVHIDYKTTIGPYCVIGSDHGGLDLRGATIRSHTIIEGGSHIKAGLETGHHVLIRTGNNIGKNFRIGSYSSLEGGAVIGDYCRFGGRCEMTQGILGDFVRLYVGSVITDNPLPPSTVREPAVLGHGSVLCAGVTVRGGVKVGLGAFVGGGAFVSKDVPDAMFYERSGRCVKYVNWLHWGDIVHPWTDHFKDDYPEESWPRIDDLNEWIKAACKARPARAWQVPHE